MTLNRNKWKEYIIRLGIASGVGAFGGLLSSLIKKDDIPYVHWELMLFGGAAAFLSILAIESLNTKKPKTLLMVALMTGLAGTSIIENARDRTKNLFAPSKNSHHGEPKEDPEGGAPKQDEPATGPPGPGGPDLSKKEQTRSKGETLDASPVEPGNSAREREDVVARALGHDDDQTLEEEYERLETKRESLEKKRAEYEMRARKLESRLRLSEIAYMRCPSGEWRNSYQGHLDDAENSRRRLEERNEQLVKLNSELRKRNNRFERQRREIEKKHRIKGEEYKDEMRNWMDRIETEYFFDLENRLFRGYEEYQHGIDLYIIGIDGAAEACQQVDLTSRSMETFNSFVRELP